MKRHKKVQIGLVIALAGLGVGGIATMEINSRAKAEQVRLQEAAELQAEQESADRQKARIAKAREEREARITKARKEREAREAESPEPVAAYDENSYHPELGSFAETVKFLISSGTPGVGSREVRQMDATLLTFEIMPLACEIVNNTNAATAKNLIADSLYRNTDLDANKSKNVAQGLVSTAQEPGVCAEISMKQN